jgi:hypothetical protein
VKPLTDLLVRLPPRLRTALPVAGPLLAYAVITTVMFWNGRAAGMAFDEVFRVNNVWEWINPDADPQYQAISSLSLFGHEIPLMMKPYISATQVLWYLPLALFSDPSTGLRLLYPVYTLAAASAGFLAFRKLWYWPAVVIPLMCLTTPLLYPEVVYGYVVVLHFLPEVLAARFFVGYLRSGSRWALFAAAAFTGLTLNVTFYSAWAIFGLGMAFIILNPRRAWRVVASWRNVLAIASGTVIGAFNYVHFNIENGFPVFRIFFERIFAPEQYNEMPIDGFKTEGAIPEALSHLELLPDYADGLQPFYVAVAALVALIAVAVAVRAIATKSWATYRWYFLPGLALMIGLAALLLSPNATRAGHFGMLIGLVESATVCAYLMAAKAFGGMIPALRRRGIPAILVAALVVPGGVASRTAVDREIRAGGEGFFTSAVFGLGEYFLDHKIPPEQILQVQWGTLAQIVFFMRGEGGSKAILWELLSRPREEWAAHTAEALEEAGPDMYVPVNMRRNSEEFEVMLDETAQLMGGSLCLVAEFPRTDGRMDIALYRLRTREATLADPLPGCADYSLQPQ